MKKQSLIKGSLILGIAGILTRFLGLFFRWPLVMLIGDEGIGYYQLSYPLYMFFVAMASGVPIAMSKLISERNAVGDVKGGFEIVKESSMLMLILGTGTSCILFLFARPIMSILEWRPEAYYSLIGISFAPVIESNTEFPCATYKDPTINRIDNKILIIFPIIFRILPFPSFLDGFINANENKANNTTTPITTIV